MTNYDQLIAQYQQCFGVRVRRWRRSLSGRAWRSRYADGSSIAWIESPYPSDTLSLAIFLHEIGHHVIGMNRYRRRCEEEYYAWRWALDEMRVLGIEPDLCVTQRFRASMAYAVHKAMRSRIRSLPPPLKEFLPIAA